MCRPCGGSRRSPGVALLLVAGVVLAACATRGDGSASDVADTPEAPARGGVTTVAYGDHPDAVADLHLPAGPPRAVVVLLHGGFWREPFRRDLMAPLADDLVARGFAVWNVEYRRVGASGGGWPATFVDVAAAIDAIAAQDVLAGLPVALVGHSAGGQLALWAASPAAPDAPDGVVPPAVEPCVVVSQAGILDLGGAVAAGVGNGAVEELLGGGPDDVALRYRAVSPLLLAPARGPVVLAHTTDDDIVPAAQSDRYAAREGGVVERVEAAGDHFAHLDPASDVWSRTVARIEQRCG